MVKNTKATPAADDPNASLNLTAQGVRELALKNLSSKAQNGEKLTDSDWARLDRLIDHDQGPDPVEALLTRLDTETKKLGKRKRIPPAIAELGKLAILARNQDHIWASIDELAAELKVSIQTGRNWCAELSIEHDRTSIAKADVYRGLWLREKEKYDNHKSEKDLQEQELKILERQARIDMRTGRLIDEARQMAYNVLVRLITDMRNDICNNWPPQITLVQAELKTSDAMEREGALHRFFKKEIGNIIDRIKTEQEDHT